MALPELLAALEREAETRIAGELEAAKAEAAAITAAAGARLTRRREDALGRATTLLRAESEQRWALASRAAERSVLASREGMLERVLTRVRERLSTATVAQAAGALLQGLLQDALAYTGSEPADIRTAPQASARVAQALDGRPGVTVVPDRTVGSGSIVATSDGRLTVDASMAGRLAAREAEARIYILRQFVGESGGRP